MKGRSKAVRRVVNLIFAGLLLGANFSMAQSAKPVQSYPAHLPYSFGNFVWWSDDELRALLKRRIPGLGDEIATTSEAKARVRGALTGLLKAKGIAAEVQSEEPSYSSFIGVRDQEAPAPSIQFSILRPQILTDKVSLRVVPEDLAHAVQSEGVWGEGKPYSAFGHWFMRSRIKQVLRQRGYLDAQVEISLQPPHKDGDLYRVSLAVAVNAGPQYHVSSIDADGGPLLAGKDLSRFFQMKTGDVPGPYPLSELASEIRQLYLHYGFADVEIETLPTLDRDRALVAYRLGVIPGPIYRLRSLTIHNLNAVQESRVRELLGMKKGDVFLDEAVNGLYDKIANEPLLKGLTFSFGPKRDNAADAIDLTLDFSSNGNESSVTIK